MRNKDKTESLVIGTDDPRQNIISKPGSLAHHNKSKVKNLSVTLDSELDFNSHINNVTKIAFDHLRNLARVRLYLTLEDAKKLTHVFVLSRLDHCNSLNSG